MRKTGINRFEIKSEDLIKIQTLAGEVLKLSDKQNQIYDKLVNELKLSESGDDLVFDYVFNWFAPNGKPTKKVSFVEYLNIYKLFKEPFYK